MFHYETPSDNQSHEPAERRRRVLWAGGVVVLVVFIGGLISFAVTATADESVRSVSGKSGSSADKFTTSAGTSTTNGAAAGGSTTTGATTTELPSTTEPATGSGTPAPGTTAGESAAGGASNPRGTPPPTYSPPPDTEPPPPPPSASYSQPDVSWTITGCSWQSDPSSEILRDGQPRFGTISYGYSTSITGGSSYEVLGGGSGGGSSYRQGRAWGDMGWPSSPPPVVLRRTDTGEIFPLKILPAYTNPDILGRCTGFPGLVRD